VAPLADFRCIRTRDRIASILVALATLLVAAPAALAGTERVSVTVEQTTPNGFGGYAVIVYDGDGSEGCNSELPCPSGSDEIVDAEWQRSGNTYSYVDFDDEPRSVACFDLTIADSGQEDGSPSEWVAHGYLVDPDGTRRDFGPIALHDGDFKRVGATPVQGDGDCVGYVPPDREPPVEPTPTPTPTGGGGTGPVAPDCSNGADDDGDGRADHPADPGCDGPDDADETDPLCGGDSFVGGRVINGGDGADLLLGTTADDVLRGLGGADRMSGGAGDDCVDGDAGDDALWGGAGNDRVGGGTGNDRVEGVAGDDLLQGGAGHDVLDGGAGKDELSGGAGDDLLMDSRGVNRFSAGGGDDWVSAAQGKRDVVACGSGKDGATLDVKDKATGCENVTRIAPATRPPHGGAKKARTAAGWPSAKWHHHKDRPDSRFIWGVSGVHCDRTGGAFERGFLRARVYAGEVNGKAGKEKWANIEMRVSYWSTSSLGGAKWFNTAPDRDYDGPHSKAPSAYWQNTPVAPKLPESFDFGNLGDLGIPYKLEARFSWFNDSSNLPPGPWDRRAHEGWIELGRCMSADSGTLAGY
jgi:hypothetical protein